MPSRYITLASFITLIGLIASTPSLAQQLTMPSDPLAGTVIESTVAPTESAVASPLTTAPMSPDAAMIGQGPISASAAGSYYNPLLGSHIRARYNTQSYGQQAGTLDLGTMKLMPYDGGMAFLDGQVTLNDESHVGYNLGVGYRWMTLPLFPFSPDDRKIMGVSVWSDGSSKGGSNFFPQIGTSLEFLGDRIDFRANGYAPVGDRTQTRDFVETDEVDFTGNGIGVLLQGVEDTALTVGEAELAGRLGNLDAWAFAGVYGMRGGIYDAVGGKVGLRGYVTPDLFLSVGLSNDDEFDTNALVNVTWFIGRTRAENCPTGRLEDRLREPVLRNNYVASQERVVSRVGDTFRATGGTDLAIFHIDSTAAEGGDGTFERPFNSLDEIESGVPEGALLLGHGGSVLSGVTGTLANNVQFVGEGNNFVTTIDTAERGTINLPETATGAQAGARPTLDGGAGSALVLGDGNTVQNLEFDGGLNAITNSPTGTNGATLNELAISNTTGNAIDLAAVVSLDADDIDGDGDTTDQVNFLGAINISDVDFDGVAGNDININADTGVLADADIIAESIAINNVTSVNNTTAQSIAIRNTTNNGTTAGTATITGLDYNGTAVGTGAGAVLIDQTAGNVTIDQTTIDGSVAQGITATQTTGSVTVTNVTYDGGTTGTGGVLADRTEGAVNDNNSTFNNGIGTAITATQATGSITVDTVTYDGGTAATGGVFFDRTEGTATVQDSTFNNGTGVAVRAVDTPSTILVNNLTYDGGTTATGGIELDRTTGPVTVNTASLTNGVGVGITADNATGAINIDGVTYEGGTTANGALSLVQTTGDIAVDNSTFNEGNGPSVNIDRTEGTISIGATVDITDVAGDSVVVSQNTGSVTVGADITNDATTTGGGVVIAQNTGIVSFDGNITTQNDQSVTITDSQANITFSGDITDNGTQDAITITDAGTNTASTAEVSFTGNLVNDDNSGRSVVITNGDDDILLSGNLTDDGDGVTITGRAAGSEVTFGTPAANMTINSEANNGITLAGNSATSVVTILSDLDITTTTGIGISSTNGQIDISNAGNSITTDSGQALNIQAGNSVTGVRFGSVIAGNTSDVTGNAIVLNNFDGTVTIDDGQLNATGDAVSLTNASLVMTGVEVNADTDAVVNATFSNALNHTLSLSDFDANGRNVAVTSTGDGNATLTLSDITGLDDTVTFNESGAGNATATLTNLTSTAGATFSSGGDGTASVTINGGSYGGAISATGNNNDSFTANVIGNTDLTAGSGITIDANNTGTFSSIVNGVTDGAATPGTAGTLDIDAAATVTDATIDVTGGNYTNVQVTAANSGTLDIDIDGVDSAGIIDIDTPASAGNTTVDVIGGTNAGVDIDAQNTGTLATRVNNVDSSGTVVINANSDVTNATYEVSGGENTGVTLASANTGTLGTTFGSVVSSGLLDFDATNTGNATIAFNGSAFVGIDVNADNNGQISYSMQNVTSDTSAGGGTATTIAFGSSITSGDVDIFGSNAFTAADAQALDLSFAGGTIDFRLANGDFENASAASSTATIGVTGAGTLGATILTNDFLNTNPGGPEGFIFETTAGSPTANLNIAANTAALGGGGAGSGEILIRENAGDIAVFELNDTFNNVGNRNNATVTFDPNDINQFDDLGAEPALPNP